MDLADCLGSLSEGLVAGSVASFAKDAQLLVHELHQRTTELEMQNRSLAEGQAQSEDTGQRFAALYDMAPFGYVTLTESGRIVELNLTASGLLGVWRDHLIDKPFGTAAGVQDLGALDDFLARCIRDRRVSRTELRVRRKGRSDIATLELWAAPKFESNGRVHCLVAFVDVARRDHDREDVRSALMHAAVPIFLCRGPGHSVVLANVRAEPIVGLLEPQNEADHSSAARQRTAIATLIDEATESGERRTVTSLPVRNRAAVRLFDVTAEPILAPGGAVQQVVVSATDVTARVRVGDELLRHREHAENASRMKDDFLALISHELRTPLNAILGWSDTLAGRTDDGPLIERGLAVVRRNAVALAKLVDDILDVSRINSGKLRVDLGAVDLGAIVTGVVDGFRPAAGSKGVSLEASLGLNTEIHGDGGRIEQIVGNLLSNAIKFTPAGGRVGLLLRRSGDFVRLTVSDNGCGIAAEDLPHVFDRFRPHERSTSRRSAGLGLGLIIVCHLVHAHGGHVAVASDGINRGATFTVDLPAMRPSMPPPPAAL
jgi:PAS domain S-box-containing protein